MIIIFLSIQSKEREVIAFLAELKEFLGKEDFDIDSVHNSDKRYACTA